VIWSHIFVRGLGQIGSMVGSVQTLKHPPCKREGADGRVSLRGKQFSAHPRRWQPSPSPPMRSLARRQVAR